MDQKHVTHPSPCLTCTRVPDPRACENKKCKPWRQWFLGRWEQIHNYPRKKMDSLPPQPVGVPLGGRHYAAPHQVQEFLHQDPCETCLCGKALCSTPCRIRRIWEKTRKEVLL